MNTPKQQGILLIEEVLKELESSKGSISVAISKLKRASVLLGQQDVIIWCDIQLGKSEYTEVLEDYVTKFIANHKNETPANKKVLTAAAVKIKEAGIIFPKHISNEELTAKGNAPSGGFNRIDFIEEKYNDLVRTKRSNDGTYYKSSLYQTLSTIKAIAHKYATELFKNYAFRELAETNFEILKSNVEDVLFNVNPELAEMLMLSFKAVSADKPEEWSHALTTCRRFFEQLADILYPPTDVKLNGRQLGKSNYINRLWAFMDKSIESDTNKQIAKAHVDFLGAYLQALYRISNKGVHTGLKRIEALKAVMHTYLLCADLLDYLDKKVISKKKLNIHSATLDEIESLANVSRTVAKEIIKLRVEHSILTPEIIKLIPKLGVQGFKSLTQKFSFESLAK